MWAVGRLSLLSRGLTEAPKRAPSVPETPVSAPEPQRIAAPATVLAPPIPTPVDRKFPPEPTIAPRPEPGPLPPPSTAPGLLERFVTRVKGFFRSFFS